MSKTSLCLLLVVCATMMDTIHADCTNLDDYILIKSQRTGLVIVGDELLNVLMLQVFEPNVVNQFQLQTGSQIGRFNIFHRSSGKVLDATDYPTGGYIATLAEPNGSETQEFHVNSDGTIVSAGYPGYALGVMNGDFAVGNFIVLTAHNEANIESEKFNLEFAGSYREQRTL